jgi:hypothetical protein
VPEKKRTAAKHEEEGRISRLVELARKELLEKGYTPEQIEALLKRRRVRDPDR